MYIPSNVIHNQEYASSPELLIEKRFLLLLSAWKKLPALPKQLLYGLGQRHMVFGNLINLDIGHYFAHFMFMQYHLLSSVLAPFL